MIGRYFIILINFIHGELTVLSEVIYENSENFSSFTDDGIIIRKVFK